MDAADCQAPIPNDIFLTPCKPSAPPKGTPLSRLKAAESILAAAEHWKKRCLLGEKSLFTEQFLWIRENFAELRRLYVDRPSDDREKLFLWKLEPQLGPDSRQVACLWAEMDWLYSPHRDALGGGPG